MVGIRFNPMKARTFRAALLVYYIKNYKLMSLVNAKKIMSSLVRMKSEVDLH